MSDPTLRSDLTEEHAREAAHQVALAYATLTDRDPDNVLAGIRVEKAIAVLTGKMTMTSYSSHRSETRASVRGEIVDKVLVMLESARDCPVVLVQNRCRLALIHLLDIRKRVTA